MFGMAARHDAVAANPVRDTAALPSAARPASVPTTEEVWDLRAKIRGDQKAIDGDLVDFVDMMLATGQRIGETSAITWPALDLALGTVEIRGTVIRITGRGVTIKLKPKSRGGWRVVELPSWAVAMLKRRQQDMPATIWGAVFTSPAGLLRDPNNTQADLRDVLGRTGCRHVSSRTFRRTVATLMDGPASVRALPPISGDAPRCP